MQISPYRPGSGRQPEVMVGRNQQLAAALDELQLTKATRAESQPVVFVGVRGLGKTVLLGKVVEQAEALGFAATRTLLDADSDSVLRLSRDIAKVVAQVDGSGKRWERWRARLATLSLEVSVAGVVTLTHQAADTRSVPDRRDQLAELLIESAALLIEHDRAGLMVGLDEVQDATAADLRVLINAINTATQARSALTVIGAGLPNSPDRMMEAGSPAERFRFLQLSRLDTAQAEAALVGPAANHGVRWDDDAAAEVIRAAAGSPYLLQAFGNAAWHRQAPDAGGCVGLTAARAGVAQATQELWQGMFRGRWDKATPGEQAVMIALAQTADQDGIARTTDISRVLRRPSATSWSTARRRLLDKGLIEPVGHGRLRFSIPGYEAYVLDHTRWQNSKT